MAVNLLFLCVLCQAIITASFGATLPLIKLEAGVVPIQPLSSPPTGRTLPSSPKVPSRASYILTEYFKSHNSGTDLPLPSSPTGITQNSLPQISSRASDILFEYFKSQYPENVVSSSLSSTGNTLLTSPQVPSQASDILLEYSKSQYSTTDFPLPSKAVFKTEPSNFNIKPPCSIPISPPTNSYDTKSFSTVSYPFSSLPKVDIYKTTAPKTYQPIYPPISTLPSLNSFSLTSASSLPTISPDALKINVNSLNQGSKLASPSYFPSLNPISEYEIRFGSLPLVNLQHSLPYPISPPTHSYDTKSFSTVSYPFSSLPKVDIYKTTDPKAYQPIYPPISTLPSLNSFSLTSASSLPTISPDALKINVNSLNQGSKLASPSYFPSLNPISEYEIRFGSLPLVNLQHSLPYPISPPTHSYDTKSFSTVSYPFSSLPKVDIYKTTAPKAYQPIYPPISTLPSLNSFSLTSASSLPTISPDALKINVNSLNQGSKLASPSYFPSLNPISEYEIRFGSLPLVNLQQSLPYPLQYTLKSLPKVVLPPVTNSLNLSSQKYLPTQPLIPKLNCSLVNDKSNLLNSKRAPEVPVSTNTYLKVSNIVNSEQILRTHPVNLLQDQLLVGPVEPFPCINLEIPTSLGSRHIRPLVPNNVPIKPIDEFRCKPFHNTNDSVRSINLNSNQLRVSNASPSYSDVTENTKTEIAQMFSSAGISILNIPELTISNATLCAQSVPNNMPDISSSTILYSYVPSYTQIIPANYLNVYSISPSSSVGNILSNIIYTYLPYLISTRIKPRKSAKVLPLNPYSVPKQIRTSSTPSISLNPELILPISSQTSNNQMTCPIVAPSTTLSYGPSTMNSQSIDITSLYNDFCSPSFITYCPGITAPISQATPLVPPAVTCMPPSFIDYHSQSQLYSHTLPSSFLSSYSEFDPPIIIDSPQTAQFKYLNKSKSVEKLLELACLAELIKGKGSVDWYAIKMALALLSAI